jgi:hypothetical protein
VDWLRKSDGKITRQLVTSHEIELDAPIADHLDPRSWLGELQDARRRSASQYSWPGYSDPETATREGTCLTADKQSSTGRDLDLTSALPVPIPSLCGGVRTSLQTSQGSTGSPASSSGPRYDLRSGLSHLLQLALSRPERMVQVDLSYRRRPQA